MNRWKHELYVKAQIGIPHGDTEANNLVIFGFMMAQFIADFRWQLSRKSDENEEDKSPHVSFKRFSVFLSSQSHLKFSRLWRLFTSGWPG